MYCKLCGEHLYKKITFKNLFKLDYDLHIECEDLLNLNKEYMAFPVIDKLIFLDYLFEESFEESDAEFLYNKYSYLLYDRLLNNKDWSIVMFCEFKIENDDMILVIELAEKSLLLLNVFNENFM